MWITININKGLERNNISSSSNRRRARKTTEAFLGLQQPQKSRSWRRKRSQRRRTEEFVEKYLYLYIGVWIRHRWVFWASPHLKWCITCAAMCMLHLRFTLCGMLSAIHYADKYVSASKHLHILHNYVSVKMQHKTIFTNLI